MTTVTLKQAHAWHMDGRLADAEQVYQKILSENPNDWSTLFFLGSLMLQTDRRGQAIALLEKAAMLKPREATIWNNLGTAYRQSHFQQEAMRAYRRTLLLSPDDLDALNNMITLSVNEGCPKDGERWAKRALSLSDKFYQMKWNYGLTLLERGIFDPGFKMYAAGTRCKDRISRHYDCKPWNGEKGRVVIYGEQGIGDEIMFFSQVPDALKVTGKVVLDCHPRLEGLFKRAFPQCTIYPTRKKDPEWVHDDPVDWKIPAGNLASMFRLKLSDFPRTPYLKADPTKVAKMRERLKAAGPGPYIGISWKGGKHKTRNDQRSVHPKDMAKFWSVNATFVSLQYTEDAAQDCAGTPIVHWPDVVTAFDYDETAALVEALDLVVSVCQSAIHLCGAIGKECWVLTPHKKAWRYYSPDGTHMVWYGDHMKLYQQAPDLDWKPVMERVSADLEGRFGARLGKA